ncbi:TetR/AcrR family transcriptional regulator [Rugamonas sp.]|uniref:TetR/AcrR family transcriptional regulator n=1 Tax=Rugamonas sp. TaxID=1926287 RepID=UPI0025D2333E|nr:TetR/AcrR family transcriptional regulator [Rugamonas sp.]
MRYEKGRKDVTRSRIVQTASRRFRAEGVEAVGLAGLMRDAGLTNGAFYVHFDSKEQLVQEVLVDALDRRLAAMVAARAQGASLGDAIRDYLSPRQRDLPDQGCPTAALAAEIARHPEQTRTLFTDKIDAFLQFIAASLPAGDPAARRGQAAALFGMMVGTLQLARAVNDAALSDRILEGGIAAGLALVGAQPSS